MKRLRDLSIFVRSFPLRVIAWKMTCRIFQIKIDGIGEWQRPFTGKTGIEVGGPSGLFGARGYLPVYPLARHIDGVNFSSQTVWEGSLREGNYYRYDHRTGFQFIAEGDDLSGIKSDAYDFVLSCNNLEHMANPLRALFEWKRIVKKGGTLLLVLPNREANFDHRRPYTTLPHLIEDYQRNTAEDDLTHLDEILRLHDRRRDPQSGSYGEFVLRSRDNYRNRCLHHHVFNQELLQGMAAYCGLDVCLRHTSYTDHFILLRKP